jgi:hypothetical protein
MENPLPPIKDQTPIQNSAVPTATSLPAQNNSKVMLVLVTIIIFLLSATGFLYYQNQKLKITVSNPQQGQITLTPTLLPSTIPDPTANWKTYTNTKYGYSFKYPSEWKTRSFAGSQESVDSASSFSLETIDSDSRAMVKLDLNNFNTGYLKKYAPTGSEDILPIQKQFGENNFYYYGAGGGGVNYTDQYFYKLNGKILLFVFNGPYGDNDNLPSKQTHSYEAQVLSTFKLLDNTTTNIPKPISDLFDAINTNFGTNLLPIFEDQFYSPSGMITKKSWKLDLLNNSKVDGKAFTIFINSQLTPNDAESGGIGGGGIDAYENNSIKCFHSYMSQGPDIHNYFSCALK